MIKTCLTCNLEFNSTRKDKKYCSRLCYRRVPEVAQRYSERTNEYQKLHSREPKRRFQKLIYKCRHEQLELNLSYEDCLTLWKQGCYYCTKSLLFETGAGLDRLDNLKGYILDNVVSCCGSCNQIRNRWLTSEEMVVAMKAVLKYRRQKNG